MLPEGDPFVEGYEAYKNGDPEKLIEAMTSMHVKEGHQEEFASEVARTFDVDELRKALRKRGDLPWDEAFYKAADKYTGMWQDARNIEDWTSIPDLVPFVSKHEHPVSVNTFWLHQISLSNFQSSAFENQI